jgi:hypothetical protein
MYTKCTGLHVHKVHRDGRHADVSTTRALPGHLLVSRIHVDLLRVSTATCPAS